MKLRLQSFRKKSVIIGSSMVIGIIGIISIALLLSPKKPVEKPKTPAENAQEQTNATIASVRSLVLTPDETPTVATIQNKETLVDQPFFKQAENGDKVLYFATAKKAILYRPSVNRVIDMSSVEVAPSGPTPTPTLGLTAPVKLAILNGTATPKQATIMEQVVTGILPTTSVISKGNAESQDPGYEKTLVVNLSDQSDIVLTTIAQAVGGLVSKLPTGEKKPEGDVLIIVGKNFVKKD